MRLAEPLACGNTILAVGDAGVNKEKIWALEEAIFWKRTNWTSKLGQAEGC